MATVRIIVERRDGEIHIRCRGRRKLHPGDVVCVELRDYEYDQEMDIEYPDWLLFDTRGYAYAGGLQMRLEVLPASGSSASAGPDSGSASGLEGGPFTLNGSDDGREP